MMEGQAQRSDRIAQISAAIEARKQKNAKRKAYSRSSGNAHARFQSFEAADLERKRARLGMRKLRSKRNHASAQPARKQCSAAKPASKRQRHILHNCCGRRSENCSCFTHGRGLEIAKSGKRKIITSIAERVAKSPIQTWRDTGDMPGYMRQIGWNASMRYSWLFPIAFMWRHFSNEELWASLMKNGAFIGRNPSAAHTSFHFNQFVDPTIPYGVIGGAITLVSISDKYSSGLKTSKSNIKKHLELKIN